MGDSELPAQLEKAHTFNVGELERTSTERGRVRYDDVETHPRRVNTAGRGRSRRSLSRDSSISMRTARRSIDPSIALPPQFRTLSFGIEEHHRQPFTKEAPQKSSKEIEFVDIDHHTLPVDDLLHRFSSSFANGLDSREVLEKIKKYGRNVPSAPPSRWFQKTFGYLFGGFGSILFIASILVFIGKHLVTLHFSDID